VTTFNTCDDAVQQQITELIPEESEGKKPAAG
jgi:hypothetical protein